MTPSKPRRFVLRRLADVSGVSGVGPVAFGVEFPDGTCAMRWATETASTAIYGSLQDLVAIHGHGGSTSIEWIDALPDRMARAGVGRVPVPSVRDLIDTVDRAVTELAGWIEASPEPDGLEVAAHVLHELHERLHVVALRCELHASRSGQGAPAPPVEAKAGA